MADQNLPNPFDALRRAMYFSQKDWGKNRDDAWLWGIIIGWDDHSLEKLSRKFCWDEEIVDFLKNANKEFKAAQGQADD